MPQSKERQIFFLICLSIVVFGLFLLLSNYHDWDLFLSFAEVDRRAWLSGEIPIWSYQFCGGVTRIGNPQLFGLSPLFLPVFLLGSFWGLKATVFLSAILGMFFFAKILRLIANEKKLTTKEVPSSLLYGLSTLLMFSNAFLWQAHVGHAAFVILIPIGIGIFYYTLKGYLVGLRWSEQVIGIFLAWSFYSGGLYHALIFFMIPIYISWILFIVIRWLCTRNPVRHIMHSLLFHAIGILISSYKILSVWEYQKAFPRTTPPLYEMSSIVDLIVYHSLPTIVYRYIIPFPLPSQWSIWEYSAFSFTTLFFIFFLVKFIHRLLAIQSIASSSLATRMYKYPVETFTLIAFVSFVVFASGNALFALSPYALLNTLLGNSVRVIGRFHMGLTFTMALALFLLLLYEKKWLHQCKRHLLVPSLILLNLNFLTFVPTLSIKQFQYILSFKKDSVTPMQQMVYAKDLQSSQSYPLSLLIEALQDTSFAAEIYKTTLTGKGVLNCYDYLNYERNLRYTEESLSLIDTDINNPSTSCVENSFFTQNTVSVHKSCPAITCLNIQSPNRYQQNNHFVFSEEHQKYCWQR